MLVFCLGQKSSHGKWAYRMSIRELTPHQMVDIVRSKLSKEEYINLYLLMDSDGPAGPLYCAMPAKAMEIAPELFNDDSPKQKKEIKNG